MSVRSINYRFLWLDPTTTKKKLQMKKKARKYTVHNARRFATAYIYEKDCLLIFHPNINTRSKVTRCLALLCLCLACLYESQTSQTTNRKFIWYPNVRTNEKPKRAYNIICCGVYFSVWFGSVQYKCSTSSVGFYSLCMRTKRTNGINARPLVAKQMARPSDIQHKHHHIREAESRSDLLPA